MNKGFYVSVLALALATVACNGKKEGALSGGIDVANLDKTVSPKTDFYQYACGGWMKTHPLTDEYGRFGSFDLLAENNRTQLHGLIKGLATQQQEPGSIGQKIGDLYNLAMDSTKLNADGMKPMKPMLDKVAAVKDRKGLTVLAAEMTRQGLGAYFNLFIGADEKNSSMNIVQAFQGGLGLGDRDYYLSDDAHNKDIRAKYEAHIARMFRLAGYEEGQAVKAAGQAMAVETDLAKAAYDRVKARDPQANYHKMTVAELERQAPGIDWNLYFKSLGLPEVKELNVAQPEALAEVAKQVGKGDLDAQKSYLLWKVIDGAASYLSDEFVEANFDFYGKVLSGTPEMQPRWKRAVSAVDGMMGEAVGKMYVEKYFPAAAKERMVKLVGNLQQALGERIRALTWMSDETKAKALEKLSAIYVKVGYPDQWRDYSSLDIKKDSYWANVLRSNVFEYDYMLAKNGKPVDKTEWMMTPQTVNAYYNPTTNEICFPAGILQYPFFDMKADDAFNYGAIGVVIGHEMTHGFDNHGRQYDKDGNLRDWWTAEDAKKFEERTQVLVDWFDKIEVLPGLHANGKLTLGENIADYGGLQVAFQAFHNAVKDAPLGVVDGFTPEQRFYLAYAGVWAANIRDEEIRLRTQTDEHSLGRWRVNATLPHIEGWYEAFGVQEGDPMYLAPDKRASIW
ncbi:MAG TPA: M13 family metallopeptidase [Candidatus Odoribacter faecigallinarum]|uniref:M13 family metallopeptidase n=1 Tax=Candidatus Odoribacter faecigallinarum TaxID=2838706 RepID=A0A9D2ABL6_9BACT|nr:M13 family metallopeptidase [Candidatus Odoribacter faecigallinarum]